MNSDYKISKQIFKCFYKLMFACIILFNVAKAQYNNDSVFNKDVITNIELKDINSAKSIFLKYNDAKPLTLFIFLSPECLLCQNYSTTLNNLYDQFGNQINFYGIISGKTYTVDTIKKFKQQYNISFPLLIDYNKSITKYLQSSVTPQVILLSNNYELLYKGAIDNRLQALGKQRINATEFFLHDALQQSLSNKAILVKRTKAVGCRINDY